MHDSFATRSRLDVDGRSFLYYSLPKLAERFASDADSGTALDLAKLPYAMKILLENLLRHEDGISVLPEHIEAVARGGAAADSHRSGLPVPG